MTSEQQNELVARSRERDYQIPAVNGQELILLHNGIGAMLGRLSDNPSIDYVEALTSLHRKLGALFNAEATARDEHLIEMVSGVRTAADPNTETDNVSKVH